jgi:peptide/nickel transport system permease protein
MREVLRRLVQLVVVVLCVTFFSFVLLSLVPGDPVTVMSPFATPAFHAQIAHDIHLDDPLIVQYWHWLSGFFTGNFGQRYFGVSGREPVATVIHQALPVTLELMAYAMILTIIIAIPLGVFSAYKAGSRFDKAANFVAFGSISLPDFALAIILQYWVGVKLGWFPTSGFVHLSQSVSGNIKSLTLPAVSLAVGQIAAYMRLLRSDMIATLQEDYILMAKAKGMPTRRVLWRHALRPSSLTVLTVAGLNIGALIGGAIVVEVIFDIPGIGTQLFLAINEHQYAEFQSLIAIIAIGFVLVNVLIDVFYSLADPRIRDARAIA